MKKLLIILFAPAIACAQGIPENCQAPMAHDMEMTNIPYLLDLPDSAAHISKIDTLGGTPAYEIFPGRYRIDCYLNVHWSNGTVDYGYRFSVWEDRYGDVKGTYGRRIN